MDSERGINQLINNKLHTPSAPPVFHKTPLGERGEMATCYAAVRENNTICRRPEKAKLPWDHQEIQVSPVTRLVVIHGHLPYPLPADYTTRSAKRPLIKSSPLFS